jgi:hypothetical protein
MLLLRNIVENKKEYNHRKKETEVGVKDIKYG